MKIETLAVHAGHEIDRGSGAVSPAIQLSTTFERDPDGGFTRGFSYSRAGNPNRLTLEKAMATLEGGVAGIAFASGSAATSALFHALKPGDRVLAQADAYYGTTKLLREVFNRWGLEADYIDLTDTLATDRALARKPRLLWVETPSNPLLRVCDIADLSARAHAAGALCVCDNTWAPVLQRPLDLGADVVMHSTTKYIGGHGDVLGGILVLKEENELLPSLREIQTEGGGVPSPFDCWLVLRGLRTLPWRMRAHSQNAAAVAQFLAGHSAVEKVHYPGLPDHPGHAIAAQQMQAFSGMLSVQIKGGKDAAMEMAARTRLFIRATSLGTAESLIEHRASVEGLATQTPENLLRLSIGLEHPDDLIADLQQALAPNET